jgi:site-specific recombinase XerD
MRLTSAIVATWLRHATSDTRLVAEYLGHVDLSTVSHYAHVATEETHVAVQSLSNDVYAKFPPGAGLHGG